MLTLLLIDMSALTFNIKPIKTEPTTLKVPDDYPTIQEAIDAANPEDTIIVSEGTYAESNIYVWKAVTLIAEGTVTVDGLYERNVFSISAPNVTIKGFTVKNSNPEYPGMGISLVGARNVVVEGNTVTNNYYGIELYYSVNNTIVNNTVTNNHEGIELFYSQNNNITGNNAENNWGAIPFHRSHNNTVAYNNVVNNSWGAIGLRESHDNNILGNNVTYSWYGIWLNGSDGNNIAQNGITNTEYSIGLDRSSRNNIIQNNVANNEHAIGFKNSSNNVYHNNFINNTEQVYIEDSVNVWDNGYPSGGNYWDDYTGEDANGDGIGDTPYVIDEKNQDNYPLMSPWIPVEETPPLWMQWWFRAITAAGIAVLVGAVYFLKKRKPPTTPPHPQEGTDIISVTDE